MIDLVKYENSEMWAESNIVARLFGVTHKDFMKTTRIVIGKLEKLRGEQHLPNYRLKIGNYRGRDFEMCLMSREFFSLVAMRFETQKAFEWQVKFNSAFYEMEKSLLRSQNNKSDIEWTSTRLIGKTARIEETDVIKEFVEYATKQGSKSAKFYYKHITDATYKALGLMAQKHPKLRDQMNIYEVSELMLAERRVTILLAEYMGLERNYKDIYQTIKKDLIDFSDNLRLSPPHSAV